MKKLIVNTVPNRLWKQWLAIGIIVVATTVIYFNALHTPFILDDEFKIVGNSDIRKLSNLKTKLVYPYDKSNSYSNINFFNRNDPSRPIVYFTFTLNYYLGKLNTFGYHLFNLVIHIFNAILLFFLTKKIVLYLYKKDSVVFSFFVALFFAVHPINTSAVTYIFSRSDVLATFFYISSLLFFIKTFEKNKKLYVFSLVCFIFALLSKQIAVTLPAIVLIFDYIFLSDFSIRKTIDKKYYHIPFWVLLFSYLLFRYLYLGGLGDVEVSAKITWNRYSYLIIQPYIILRYLQLLLVPVGLCIYHVMTPVKTLDLKTIISFISLAAIFWLTYRTYKKKTNNSRIVIFSVVWFFITLSPTSSFFPTTSPLVENRMYLSGIGFYFFIVFLYFSLFKIDFAEEFNENRNWFFSSIIMFHILLLGYGTIKRNQLYQQPILMWQNVISKYPNNPESHNKLGILLYNSKRYEEAEKEYRETIRINPNNADAHNNLGVLLYNSKRYEEAEKECREVIRIMPNYVNAHYNLGFLLYNLKRFKEAEKEYREAIRINPNIAEVHNNLGILYCYLKEYKKALQEFEIVLRLDPHNKSVKDDIRNLKRILNEPIKR
ncbi:MAG: tetratricopeptide repeat protein [Elusimicrobiota bacterium]